MEEGIHTSREVRVHRRGVAVVQARVGHRHRDAAPVEAELLSHRACAVRAIVTPHDLRGNLVVQLRPRRRLDPQDRVGPGQRCQLRRRHLAREDIAEAELRFVRHRLKDATRHGPVLC